MQNTTGGHWLDLAPTARKWHDGARFDSVGMQQGVEKDMVQSHSASLRNDLYPATTLYLTSVTSSDIELELSISATNSTDFSEMSRTELFEDYNRVLSGTEYATVSVQASNTPQPMFEHWGTGYFGSEPCVVTEQPANLSTAQSCPGTGKRERLPSPEIGSPRRTQSECDSRNSIDDRVGKRRAQNRRAQRAYRDRQSQTLSECHRKLEETSNEVLRLRAREQVLLNTVETLAADMTRPKTHSQAL